MEIIKSEIDELIENLTKNTKKLILYNDDINTFDNVINCLCDYCKHSLLQAEQCAYLVHYNKKADIKLGTFDELLPIYNALKDNNLIVEIC